MPAGVFGAVLSERQLVPPLPGEQLRAAGADLGNQQPHRVAAGSGGPPSSRHIEHRICGADANPYLAAAALLAAVRLGIRERLDPGAPITGNGYAQATQALPSDWLTELRALEGSAWAREALGEDFPKIYLAIKQAEYRAFMGEVGEQDWRWYLNQA